MSLPWLVALTLAMTLAAANVVATIRLTHAPWFSRGQKIAQLVLLWLLPAAGFALVWHFTHETAPPRVTTDLRNRLESDDVARALARSEEDGHDVGDATGGGDG